MRIERESLIGHLRSGRHHVTGGRVRPIVRMPDPLLRRGARVCGPGDPGVADVVADLSRTMSAHPGCRALSAPQIGYLLRLIAVDVSGPHSGGRGGPLVLINPQLVVATGLRTGAEECLSIPNVVANVRRADRILAVAFSPEGGTMTLELVGSEAALLLHQLDHLDGVLTLDRLQSLSDLSPQAARPPRLPAEQSPVLPPGAPARRTSA